MLRKITTFTLDFQIFLGTKFFLNLQYIKIDNYANQRLERGR